MSSYYLINLLIYAAVDAMACLGLSQQFGFAGVTNFGFIIFQAGRRLRGRRAGHAVRPRPTAASSHTSAGWHLPFPLPWIGAAVVGGAARPARSSSWSACGCAATSPPSACWSPRCCSTCWSPTTCRCSTATPGISLDPGAAPGRVQPAVVGGTSGPSRRGAIVLCAVVYLLVRRGSRSRRTAARCGPCATTTSSPTRSARTCASLRTAMLVTGGAIAGLSGGILVSLHHHLVARPPGATPRPSCCSPR